MGEHAEICLDVDAQTVTFSSVLNLFVDFLAFDELIDAGNAMAAVDLYRGELLEVIAVDESPACDEWLFLARELGVEPMAAITALSESLYTSELLAESESSQRELAQAHPLPFVGCEAELAHLNELYKVAIADRSSLVFIKGESGSGKTELVLEFLR
jgi:hypothetical protein